MPSTHYWEYCRNNCNRTSLPIAGVLCRCSQRFSLIPICKGLLLVVDGFLQSQISGILCWFLIWAFIVFSLISNDWAIVSVLSQIFLDLRWLGSSAGRHWFYMDLQRPGLSLEAFNGVHALQIAEVSGVSPSFL